MIRPYRLINVQEMDELNQHLTQVIQDWNKEYALIPFDVHLTAPPKEYVVNQNVPILADNQTVATIEQHYLELINQLLFGENKPCFDSTSKDLFLILLCKLLKLEECTINNLTTPTPDWFYKGSTCLLLTLSIHSSQDHTLNTKEDIPLNTLTILLSPEWVYQSLAPYQNLKNNLASIDEALSERLLTLNLELNSLSLPINQLINLQIGDVITTEHPISTTLKLTQAEQLIAEAELGQSAFHKSIVLKRST